MHFIHRNTLILERKRYILPYGKSDKLRICVLHDSTHYAAYFINIAFLGFDAIDSQTSIYHTAKRMRNKTIYAVANSRFTATGSSCN